MRILKTAALAFAAIVATSATGGLFGEDRIDGSDDDAFQSSMEAIIDGLTEDELKAFQSAIIVVTLDAVLPDESKGQGLLGLINVDMESPVTKALIRNAMDGLTFAELQAKAAKITTEAESRQAQKAADEEKQAAAKAAKAARDEAEREQSAKAYVLRLAENVMFNAHSFRKDDDGFISKYEADVQVANRSDLPIAGVTFRAEMRTPGRAMPWREEDDKQVWFRGGIESGETREKTTGLDWYDDFPEDAVFTGELQCVYGPPEDEVHHPMFDPPDGECSNIRDLW